jgi:hypothetical protein
VPNRAIAAISQNSTSIATKADYDRSVRVQGILVAALLAGAPALAHAQSVSAPIVVRATVVSTCTVDVPRTAERGSLSTLPVAVTCARGGAPARVQRPAAHRRSEVRDAVLLINF